MSEQTSAELSVLECLYRGDGGDFKTHGTVVLRGYQEEAEGKNGVSLAFFSACVACGVCVQSMPTSSWSKSSRK